MTSQITWYVVSENCARVGSRKSRCMLVPLARVTLSSRKQTLKADLHDSICQGTDLALEGVNTGTANQEKRLTSLFTYRFYCYVSITDPPPISS